MSQKRAHTVLTILAAGLLLTPASLWAAAASSESELGKLALEGDPELLDWMAEVNRELEETGLGIAVESIEFFSIGQSRPSNRIHQKDFRWVAGDQWSQPREAPGSRHRHHDFDHYLGAGGMGDPFAADIVQAGWFPAGPPFFDSTTIAFSVTYIFMDDDGVPTDVSGDNFLDTALNEVYSNDGFVWGINASPPMIDVQTIELHELGHSLGIGHFGPPPLGVMNPVYAGRRQSLYPIDHSGVCTVWASWPN